MANFMIGDNGWVGSAANDTVFAFALNNDEVISTASAGAGIDTLALSPISSYAVWHIESIPDFEVIRLGGAASYLYLGSQSVAVIGDSRNYEKVYLGTGAVTCANIDEVYT